MSQPRRPAVFAAELNDYGQPGARVVTNTSNTEPRKESMGEQRRGLGEFHRALRAVSPVPARLVLPCPRPVEAQAVPSTRCQQRPAREHVRDRSSAQAGKPAGSTFSSNLNADPSRPRTGATLLDFGHASRHHSRTKPHSRVMASAGGDRRTV